jgi:hypothetical protein
MSDKIDPTASAIGGGLASFGKIRAVIGAFLAVIIIIVLISFGYDRLHDKHTAVADGHVTAITTPPGCTATPGKDITTYSCPVTISYSANGNTYTLTQTLTDDSAFTVGERVTVYYDPTNPSDSIVEFDPKTAAYLLFGGAGIIFFIVLINTILVFKYQAYATVSGGVGIVDLIRR